MFLNSGLVSTDDSPQELRILPSGHQVESTTISFWPLFLKLFVKHGFEMQKQELVPSPRYNWFSLYNSLFSMERMQHNLVLNFLGKSTLCFLAENTNHTHWLVFQLVYLLVYGFLPMMDGISSHQEIRAGKNLVLTCRAQVLWLFKKLLCNNSLWILSRFKIENPSFRLPTKVFHNLQLFNSYVQLRPLQF